MQAIFSDHIAARGNCLFLYQLKQSITAHDDHDDDDHDGIIWITAGLMKLTLSIALGFSFTSDFQR
jgi:hypothetical protein